MKEKKSKDFRLHSGGDSLKGGGWGVWVWVGGGENSKETPHAITAQGDVTYYAVTSY